MEVPGLDEDFYARVVLEPRGTRKLRCRARPSLVPAFCGAGSCRSAGGSSARCLPVSPKWVLRRIRAENGRIWELDGNAARTTLVPAPSPRSASENREVTHAGTALKLEIRGGFETVFEAFPGLTNAAGVNERGLRSRNRAALSFPVPRCGRGVFSE